MKQLMYETRPLQSWQKCKEIRLRHYQDFITARERGLVIVTGSAGGAPGIVQGLEDAIFLGGEPYGAAIATDLTASQACMEAYESHGFARDTCSYQRNYMGSMYLNQYFFGGPFPRPDICITAHICDTHAKWFQLVSEYFGVPYFGVDIPLGAVGIREQERTEYLANQILDAAEWLEKTTGKKFNDEKFMRTVYNEYEVNSLWSQICLLNQAVPATLDHKALFTLYYPGFILKHLDETAAFYRLLRDEIQDRVDNHIAALPVERARLLHDGQPPWFFLRLFRIMEQYGAVCIGSHYAFTSAGHFDVAEDGTWRPTRTLKERGIELKSREDVARALARVLLEEWETIAFPHYRGQQVVDLAKQWRAEGVVMHLNRGCEGSAFGQLEGRLMLLQSGVPVMTYEGNMADRRELDEAQVLDRLESFMESLGLSKLS